MRELANGSWKLSARSPVPNKMKLPGQVQQAFWKLQCPWGLGCGWGRGRAPAFAFECSLNTQQQAKVSRVAAIQTALRIRRAGRLENCANLAAKWP